MTMSKKNISSISEISAYQIYFRLLGYIKPYMGIFLLSVFGYILYAIANVYYSRIMENLVNTIDGKDGHATWIVPAQIVFATLLRGVGMFIGGYFMAKVAFKIIDVLRVQVFNHMTRLPVEVMESRPGGHLVSLITYNINGVTAAATDALKKGLREGATVIGLLIWLLYLDWQLTLMFLAVAPIMGWLVSTVARRLRRLSTKVQDTVGDITQVSSEMIDGYRVMRSFGAEHYEQKRFADASAKNYKQNMKIVMTSSANAPLMHLLIAVSMSFLIYAALSFMQIGDTATFIGYITAVGMIVNPLRQLGEVAPMILKGVAAADSVFQLLDEKEEKDTGTKELTNVKGAIEFKQVDFKYASADQPILRNFNLQTTPGEVIALVGKSGSGKSTIVNLLPRFYEVTGGEILVDGVPINEVTLKNLRAQIALVNQQVILFNGTIAENIAYGIRDSVTEEDINRAADLAFVTDFAKHLPEGLQSYIGEGGAWLSGGQRQRIAIARAILKNAPILILDEATSALDNESEHFVQAALEQVMKGRTTFVIAHRLSTIEKADKIIVMGDGGILEAGTHEALLEAGGAYSRLHSRQYGNDETNTPDASH
jgi:subfamily B ATP-binding cassette protein MsbA